MAVIKLGPMITDIRGSIGGTTFARNRSGMYARTRVKPIDPSSTRQQSVRNAVAACQTAWRDTLTQAQRDGWDNVGAVGGGTGALGDQIRLTGIQAYIRVNVIVLLAGLAAFATAPALPYHTALPALTFTCVETPGLVITATTPVIAAGAALQIQVSGVYSATKNFFKGPWPYAMWFLTADTVPISIPAGEPYITADRLFVAARYVDEVGRISQVNRFTINTTDDP